MGVLFIGFGVYFITKDKYTPELYKDIGYGVVITGVLVSCHFGCKLGEAMDFDKLLNAIKSSNKNKESTYKLLDTPHSDNIILSKNSDDDDHLPEL